MNDLTTNLKELEYIVHQKDRVKASIRDVSSAGLSAAMVDEQRASLQGDLDTWVERLERKVLHIVRFPPHHIKHQAKLPEFWKHGGLEESVFIMTKYPRKADDPERNIDDRCLEAVIKAVSDAVADAGYKPRLATDRKYHAGLWDNLELYILGSSRGVAIVQDKYGETDAEAAKANGKKAKRPGVNPNVAMEWGWMRAIDTDVHYLIEEDTSEPADYEGLLKSKFKWTDPSQAITAAISDWLPKPQDGGGRK